MHYVTEYAKANAGEYLSDISQIQKCVCCTKHLKDNKHIMAPIWLKKYGQYLSLTLSAPH